MKFSPTKLPGVWIVDLEKHADERGFFARSWCQQEFEQHGLNPRLVQCSVSFNHKKGTLRGMHYQIAPHEEAKLVRCTRGAIYDVAVDLRPASPTRKQRLAVELTAETGRALYLERQQVAPEVELSAAERTALEAGRPPERVARFERIESGLAEYF